MGIFHGYLQVVAMTVKSKRHLNSLQKKASIVVQRKLSLQGLL